MAVGHPNSEEERECRGEEGKLGREKERRKRGRLTGVGASLAGGEVPEVAGRSWGCEGPSSLGGGEEEEGNEGKRKEKEKKRKKKGERVMGEELMRERECVSPRGGEWVELVGKRKEKKGKERKKDLKIII